MTRFEGQAWSSPLTVVLSPQAEVSLYDHAEYTGSQITLFSDDWSSASPQGPHSCFHVKGEKEDHIDAALAGDARYLGSVLISAKEPFINHRILLCLGLFFHEKEGFNTGILSCVALVLSRQNVNSSGQGPSPAMKKALRVRTKYLRKADIPKEIQMLKSLKSVCWMEWIKKIEFEIGLHLYKAHHRVNTVFVKLLCC